jgi:hypothetical protein
MWSWLFSRPLGWKVGEFEHYIRVGLDDCRECLVLVSDLKVIAVQRREVEWKVLDICA